VTSSANITDKVEYCQPIAQATLLDPSFKNVNFKNAIACSGAIVQLRKMVVELQGEAATSSTSSAEEEEESAPYCPNLSSNLAPNWPKTHSAKEDICIFI